MLEDAVLANSPIALSFSSASLLGMPYCFASSETRVLATILLLARTRGGSQTNDGWCRTNWLIARYSSSAHELLLQSLSVGSVREATYSPTGTLDSPPAPGVIRSAREKAFRRTARS